MLVAVVGAVKNVGDYLIGDRALRLLRSRNQDDIHIVNRFNVHQEDVEKIRSARAVVLCGGPAYKDDTFPGVYPKSITETDAPIFPLGLGWSGRPVGKPEDFSFLPESRAAIQVIHDRIRYSSTRDSDTHHILARLGFDNVMTGCPAWYDLECIDDDFEYREDVKRLVFTPPARPTVNSIRVMRYLAARFKNAELVCSFHRGILPDKLTPAHLSIGYAGIAAIAKLYGYRVVDASYDLEKIGFYADCDFHVGYRVHAHIYFLSKRLPTLLINEDGRGQGQAKALGLRAIDGDQPELPENVAIEVEAYFERRGEAHQKAVGIMRATYPQMIEYVDRIRDV